LYGSDNHGWTVEQLGRQLKISTTHAELTCEALRAQGTLIIPITMTSMDNEKRQIIAG